MKRNVQFAPTADIDLGKSVSTLCTSRRRTTLQLTRTLDQHGLMSAVVRISDITRTCRDFRFVPILLQKSSMMGPGGWREFLELGACQPLPSKGWSDTTAAELCARYAKHGSVTGGGRTTSFASLRRFCAIAASVNSNWAPHGPRSRRRPSRKIRLRCANSISTRLRSRRDRSNASVLASARATSRASS